MLAKSFARIHWQNLVNFGVLPLRFSDERDYDGIERDDVLAVDGVHEALLQGSRIRLRNLTRNRTLEASHGLFQQQRETLLAGGMLGWMARRLRGSKG